MLLLVGRIEFQDIIRLAQIFRLKKDPYAFQQHFKSLSNHQKRIITFKNLFPM